MRVLNAIQRVLLLLLLIPVIAICLDTLLRAFKAQATNPIVSGVRNVANVFVIRPFKTVFVDQNYVQDAAVALAVFGLIALLIVFLFRGLRSLVSARPPRVRSAPAAQTAPTAKKAPADTAAPAQTTEKPAPATTGTAADKDGQSTSG